MEPTSSRRVRRVLVLAGCLLLGLWATWWLANGTANHLVGGSKTWVPRYRFLGVDFLHNHEAVRVWLQGRSPYREVLNPDYGGEPYSYPPMVLRLFAWTALFAPRAAVLVWIGVLALLVALGVWACTRQRVQLGLTAWPFPVVLAFVLWSTPVVYALERGNYDLVALALLLATAALLSRCTGRADWLAGACLALAASLKMYPALGGLVFLMLRRPRAVLGSVVAGGFLVLADLPGTLLFLENARTVFARHVPAANGRLHETMHTLSGSWGLLWNHPSFEWLATLPGQVGWAVLMLPPLAWVSWRLARCPEPRRLILPYLLWVTAVATFLPSVSNDYNLFFLPLAALTVWDRRDPVLAHVLLALLIVWWQPFLLPTGPWLLLACKIAGVYSVALSLAQRIAEQAAHTVTPLKQASVDAAPPRLTAA